jgi:hypothetical protein
MLFSVHSLPNNNFYTVISLTYYKREVIPNKKIRNKTLLSYIFKNLFSLHIILNYVFIWLNAMLCCSAKPLVYRPCVDCERTCDNHEALAKAGACRHAPREGCFCPDGKVTPHRLSIGKGNLHLMDNAKKRWTTFYWLVNKFLKESHLLSHLAKERAQFLNKMTFLKMNFMIHFI